MGVVQPYLDNLSRMKDSIDEIAKEAIKANIDEILQLNKNQLINSIGADGKKNRSRYKPITENYWRYVDPPQDPDYKITRNKYDFYWSGETQDNMFLEITDKDTFSIFSAGAKAAYIEAYYKSQGFEMFGLTPENNQYINEEIILPYLQRHILHNMLRV